MASRSAPSLAADTRVARRAARQARLAQERSAVMRGGSAPRQKIRGRSFSNELGAPMLISADAVPSFSRQIGAANVNSNRERGFITDCHVFHNLGLRHTTCTRRPRRTHSCGNISATGGRQGCAAEQPATAILAG